MKNPFKAYDNKFLSECLHLIRDGIKRAKAGEFDAVWSAAPDIGGRSQREIFFENAPRNLAHVVAEMLSRGLLTN